MLLGSVVWAAVAAGAGRCTPDRVELEVRAGGLVPEQARVQLAEALERACREDLPLGLRVWLRAQVDGPAPRPDPAASSSLARSWAEVCAHDLDEELPVLEARRSLYATCRLDRDGTFSLEEFAAVEGDPVGALAVRGWLRGAGVGEATSQQAARLLAGPVVLPELPGAALALPEVPWAGRRQRSELGQTVEVILSREVLRTDRQQHLRVDEARWIRAGDAPVLDTLRDELAAHVSAARALDTGRLPLLVVEADRTVRLELLEAVSATGAAAGLREAELVVAVRTDRQLQRYGGLSLALGTHPSAEEVTVEPGGACAPHLLASAHPHRARLVAGEGATVGDLARCAAQLGRVGWRVGLR